MRDFKTLTVWRKAHLLTLRVYQITSSFPPEEKYGLTSQLRRSSASVPTNIAEGCGKESERDFARFLSISSGSASEAEYQFMLAKDLGYIQENVYIELDRDVNEIKKMLRSFIGKLDSK